MEDLFSDYLQFSCNKCSRCCTGEPGFVFLSEEDVEKLSSFLSCTREQFIECYCRMVKINQSESLLSLKEKANYECILWKDGCSAYGARPTQCIAYPFWTRIKDKDSWEKEKHSCPGINVGKKWSKEEVCKMRNLYEESILSYIREVRA